MSQRLLPAAMPRRHGHDKCPAGPGRNVPRQAAHRHLLRAWAPGNIGPCAEMRDVWTSMRTKSAIGLTLLLVILGGCGGGGGGPAACQVGVSTMAFPDGCPVEGASGTLGVASLGLSVKNSAGTVIAAVSPEQTGTVHALVRDARGNVAPNVAVTFLTERQDRHLRSFVGHRADRLGRRGTRRPTRRHASGGLHGHRQRHGGRRLDEGRCRLCRHLSDADAEPASHQSGHLVLRWKCQRGRHRHERHHALHAADPRGVRVAVHRYRQGHHGRARPHPERRRVHELQRQGMRRGRCHHRHRHDRGPGHRADGRHQRPAGGRRFPQVRSRRTRPTSRSRARAASAGRNSRP